ncbi:dTDP-glucose 4,6-dehydratase [Rhizobium sp. YIM 134829]|uniref:dTDP-glucose 4,6-dehydratase n=1 Tax=Rhizobium sp. YIM 134829 TaxID=3390453 RepID=UPI003978713A
MRVLVTGGAGFIGSALVRHLVLERGFDVLTVDKLTYAGCLASLADLDGRPNHNFLQADICDEQRMRNAFAEFRPDWVMHLAAESHVDRSIVSAGQFIQTNVVGTYSLLSAARGYWERLKGRDRERFRFLHVSTDEVFGSLGRDGYFTEETPYDPSSPYSASKAASDHLIKAWHRTYGLPTILTNCSNNYGPRQFPEKLIPLTIINALEQSPIRIYGQGLNIRDWLHVDDHVRALVLVASSGRIGETYTIGSSSERTNLRVVETICQLMDSRFPDRAPHIRLAEYVEDRPGHDFRYAIDASRVKQELMWAPRVHFEEGLAATVDWYLQRGDWWKPLRSAYDGKRLGLPRKAI